MTEPVNNEWLSQILSDIHGSGVCSAKELCNYCTEAKQAILSKLESIEQEAYTKGYIQKGIDAFNEENNNRNK